MLTDAAAAQVNYTPKYTTLDSLIHIATSPSTTAPRFVGIEFQTYTITCNITIKKNETDNDYHLVLQNDNSETMIGEVPDPTCSVASTSAHVNDFIAARNWVNTHIGTGAVSNVNIPLVDITGVAFVDAPHGQTGLAPNCMEIHPILKIQFSTITGLDTMKYAPNFSVNVNPTTFTESTNFLITSFKEVLGKCRLELYSITGDKVKDIDLPVIGNNEINYTFKRNGLTNGLYIYRILNNDATMYEGKIIIQ